MGPIRVQENRLFARRSYYWMNDLDWNVEYKRPNARIHLPAERNGLVDLGAGGVWVLRNWGKEAEKLKRTMWRSCGQSWIADINGSFKTVQHAFQLFVKWIFFKMAEKKANRTEDAGLFGPQRTLSLHFLIHGDLKQIKLIIILVQ